MVVKFLFHSPLLGADYKVLSYLEDTKTLII